MFKDKLMTIAQLFGIGGIEFAPGSWASLATCIILYPILKFGLGVKITLIIIISILGIYAADYAEKKLNEKDPRSIVIDEVAGQLITLTFIGNPSFLSVFLGFILFRILDVFKPPPIRQIEERFSGGFGIMIDDIAAGIIGGCILWLILKII
ncbi:phosphatidylglycerophosphatase A family protein [Desulfothermus sp.]